LGGLLLLGAETLHPTILLTTINTDPGPFASEAAGTASRLHGIMFILGQTGVIFGLLALYSYLSSRYRDTLALPALLTSLLALVLVMPFVGVAAYAIPLSGASYLAGHHDSLDWITHLQNSPATAIEGIAALLLGLVGAVLFAVVFWRSGVVPKPAAVLWAAGFTIEGLTPGLPPPLRVVDGLLLAIACGWVALVLWRAAEETAAGP
jgi:hypothetical protein